LLRNLRQRKLFKTFERCRHKQVEWLQAQKVQTSDHFYLSYLEAAESDAYYAQLGQHKADLSIQRKQNQLDQFYLSEKLKDACEMLIRSRILKVNYSNPMLERLLKEVEQNLRQYEAVAPLMVYYYLYQLIKMEERPYYFQALEVIRKYEAQLRKVEMQNIYNYLQNYCIVQTNKGSRTFLQQSFELYQKQLEKKLLMDKDGFLLEWHYKNIVAIVMRLGEMDWVKNFIETYRHELPPEVMENAYTFNLAAYYYATHQLEKVQQLLIQVEYKDIRYSLAAKSLLLRTYYDLQEYDALQSLVKSFREYLRRHKLIPDQRRKAFLRLLQLTKVASQIQSAMPFQRAKKTKRQILELRTDIEKSKELINREWLIGKVEEMEVKY
ncbi:MAG: hypothetical protein AAF985_24945, partial [Bacteroidota bacterium]